VENSILEEHKVHLDRRRQVELFQIVGDCLQKLGLVGTTRASFYVYNDEADVDVLIDSILEAQKYFKV